MVTRRRLLALLLLYLISSISLTLAMRSFHSAALASTLAFAGITDALQVDVSSVQSISDAAKTIASNIIDLYEGKNGSPSIPGLFPDPYYFWESGLAWDSLINYWALTGDDTYNDRISEALIFQSNGDKLDFAPVNQSTFLGNDDQSTWALAAMTAAEKGFPSPLFQIDGQQTSNLWAQMAQNVFDEQVLRWDTKSCGGGLRWQIFSFTNGYDYKNSISNGNFMQLAARLELGG